MHFTTATLATLGLMAMGATADFNVYCGLEIEGSAPTGDAYYCHFYGTDADPPSCDTVSDSVTETLASNDASGGGIACDGCEGGDGTPHTWEITRFEYNDDEGNDFPKGTHFTLYKNDDGGFRIEDTNNNQLGTCSRPADVSTLQYDCSSGLSGRNQGEEIFHCTSSLSHN